MQKYADRVRKATHVSTRTLAAKRRGSHKTRGRRSRAAWRLTIRITLIYHNKMTNYRGRQTKTLIT